MKKKMLSMLVASMVMLSMVACGTKGSTNLKSESGIGNTSNDAEQQNSVKDTDVYHIGIIQHVEHPSLNQIRETIIEEVRAQGYGEDKVVFEYVNANGEVSLLPTIYQNLISNGVDMLIPIATPTAQAAMAATTSIPIIFSAVSSPVESGLVPAMDQTTGNITGVADAIPVEEIIRLATELTPDVKSFGFLYNSSEVNSITNIQKAKEYCDSNGIAYKEATITSTADLQQAASSLVSEVDAFFTPNDNMVASAMPTYVQVANDSYVPMYVGADSMVADGGLATVGIDYGVLGRQTGAMAVRIMNGEAITDNPVEAIADYAKIINQATAKHLGIEISKELLDTFVIIGN